MTTNVIWHGDCLETIDKIDEPVNCVVTDPPYGVDYVSFRATTPEGLKTVRKIDNDGDIDGATALFLDAMYLLLPRTTPQAELYVFTKWDIIDAWLNAIRLPLEGLGFRYKMMIVWAKGVPGMGDIDNNWGCGHELIMYFKKGMRPVPYKRSAIITVDKVHPTQQIHPTEKPVGLIEKLIEMSTDAGDLVVDPFSGSGSTSVAARNLGRRSIGIEKDEEYVQKSRRRLSQMTFV